MAKYVCKKNKQYRKITIHKNDCYSYQKVIRENLNSDKWSLEYDSLADANKAASEYLAKNKDWSVGFCQNCCRVDKLLKI